MTHKSARLPGKHRPSGVNMIFLANESWISSEKNMGFGIFPLNQFQVHTEYIYIYLFIGMFTIPITINPT